MPIWTFLIRFSTIGAWTIVERFEGQTEDFIALLKKHPLLGKPSEFKGLRKYVINKHVSLIYRIKPDSIDNGHISLKYLSSKAICVKLRAMYEVVNFLQQCLLSF